MPVPIALVHDDTEFADGTVSKLGYRWLDWHVRPGLRFGGCSPVYPSTASTPSGSASSSGAGSAGARRHHHRMA